MHLKALLYVFSKSDQIELFLVSLVENIFTNKCSREMVAASQMNLGAYGTLKIKFGLQRSDIVCRG